MGQELRSGARLGAQTPGRALAPLVCCLVMDSLVDTVQAACGALTWSVPWPAVQLRPACAGGASA